MTAAPRPIDAVFVHGLFSSVDVWDAFDQLIQLDPDLAAFVTTHRFGYSSPKFRFRPDRRIAELDDLADRLSTYLTTDLEGARSIVLVTHSQGGLVAQRFLARTLQRQRGRDLARVKRIIMFTCPNSGSDFLLSVRQMLGTVWRNPQERQLRPFNRLVMETQETVLHRVLHASGCTDSECRIPISVYAGISDNIVKPYVANWGFTNTGLLDGDHFSVIQPTNSASGNYRALKNELLAAINPEPPPAGPATPTTTTTSVVAEQTSRFSVAPPFGQIIAELQGEDRQDIISAVLSLDGPDQVHVLAGLGGSGKTRLALEIAKRAPSNRRVWWISMARVNACMREVANQIGVPEGQIEQAWRGASSATDLVWHYLDRYAEPWLLVFDNADDPDRLSSSDAPVSDGTGWLRRPASTRGTVIVTSRDRSPETWGPWSKVHVVAPLNSDDGAVLLMNLVGAKAGSGEQARKLSEQLGGLPLMLKLAAQVIRISIEEDEISLTSFQAYGAEVERRFASPAGAHPHDPNDPLDDAKVREVFDLPLQALANRGLDDAAPLLKLLACLSIAPIPHRLLLAQTTLAESTLFTDFSSTHHEILVSGLADFGLVDQTHLTGVRDPQLSHFLSLHPVIHGLLREDADVTNRRADYYGLGIRTIMAATKYQEPDLSESWPVWDIVAPHALEVTRTVLLGEHQPSDRKVVVSALELARLTSRYLIETGLLKPARDLIFPIVDRCNSFGFEPDEREILALRHEKGRIFLEQGELAAAEAEFNDVIAGREEVLGHDHSGTLASRHKLAKAILEQGRWKEAENLLRSIVAAEKQVRGPEHSDTMVVRHSLARAILSQGSTRAAEAELMIREILDIRNRIWSPSTPETLFTRLTLARSLYDQQKYAEAEGELREAIRTAAQRPDSPKVLSLRHTLAQTLLTRGKLSEARDQAALLLEDRTRVLGETHPDTERTRQLLKNINTIPDDAP